MSESVFCLSPKGQGWLLHREGFAEGIYFEEKAAATVCATTWAFVHQPSELCIEQPDGTISRRTFQ